MSWNNVIPAELLLGVAKMEPAKVENPEVTIPEELVTACLVRYTIGDYGMTASKDSPAFSELRKVLASRGYIEIPEYACVNGDSVAKRFIFNGLQLEVGDTFYSAAAWSVRFSMRDRS